MPARHTPEDVERGLTALAIEGTSPKAAAITGFSQRTIRDWAQTHHERLAAIKERRAPLIDAACVDEFRKIVLNGARATQGAIAAAQAEIEAGEVKDPAATARNLATTAAIASDKIALMEGRPTAIIEHRSADDVLKDLDRLGFVDASAVELGDEEATSALSPESAVPNARELPASTGRSTPLDA